MRRWLAGFALLLALLALLALLPALAPAAAATAEAPLQFRDGAEETRFRALASELRCVMCQNQSLADSDAPIAHDLRRQVLEMMREGRSDAQIKQYLVARYSEFVLYEPGLRPATAVLWFGPLLLVLAGAGVVVAIVRRRARALPQAAAVPAADESDQEW